MDADFMRRNIESAEFVVSALSGTLVIGENISYQDFVEQTMGIRPEMVPEDDLASQKQEMEEIVEELGYKYTRGNRSAFNQKYTIQSDQMQTVVETAAAAAKEDLIIAAGPEVIAGLEEVRVGIVKDKNTWQGYFGIDEETGEFIILANSNPKIQITPIEERIMLAHERGHWLSAAIKKAKLTAGKLSPARAMLLGFSPAYSEDEVIARTVEEHTIGRQDSLLSDYVFGKMKYVNDVGTNMKIMANSGHSAEEVVEYGREYMPFEKPSKIRKDVEMYVGNLLFKTVFGVDGEAVRRGRQIAALPDKERKAALVELCAGSVKSDELVALAN
jgi:hypothetical protein